MADDADDWKTWAAWALELAGALAQTDDRAGREQMLVDQLAERFAAQVALHVHAAAEPPRTGRRRIVSKATLSNGQIATLIATRPPKLKPFAKLDALRLDLLNSGLTWVHLDRAGGGDRLQKLSPREREAMQLFVAGQTEKDVATLLGRSRHTVHAYVKRIYRTLGVRSRSELRRLLVGDLLMGGAGAAPRTITSRLAE